MPNPEIEKPWFSPQKFKNTLKKSKSMVNTINMMSPANRKLTSMDSATIELMERERADKDRIEKQEKERIEKEKLVKLMMQNDADKNGQNSKSQSVIEKTDKLDNKERKKEEPEVSVYKNTQVSSYGFHYWDYTKGPDDKVAMWPPLPDT
eukprot:CAMPEP_0116896840 /NCGR_PEP_ID=MMETSP0467-20121206/5985_1 /TAXON_ID=283647 /ORGANISM="Mesodinium pulex, Strain SPMC105" /LENGTH=149 /DNA_ID=CAMNT_0004568215 /DNA_START=242 /DNA_END=691 /DNA_ORIENTATION=+